MHPRRTVALVVTALAGPKNGWRKFRPTFADGLTCQQVLAAVERSAKTRRWVKVASVR